MRFPSWELKKNHMSEMWLESPHKLRHSPLLQGWRPWDTWEVLKHLSVSWLFLISISEKRDLITTGLCVNCDKYVGDVRVHEVRESTWSSLSFHHMQMACLSSKADPAPGDPLSWKVYFQPASAHLPAIFKQSWGAWLAASGVID